MEKTQQFLHELGTIKETEEYISVTHGFIEHINSMGMCFCFSSLFYGKPLR